MNTKNIVCFYGVSEKNSLLAGKKNLAPPPDFRPDSPLLNPESVLYIVGDNFIVLVANSDIRISYILDKIIRGRYLYSRRPKSVWQTAENCPQVRN